MAETLPGLAIEANDLLVVRCGDDPALLYGLKLSVCHHACSRCSNLSQGVDDPSSRVVLADDSAGGHTTTHGTNVMNHVGRAAERGILGNDSKHGHRRLWR